MAQEASHAIKLSRNIVSIKDATFRGDVLIRHTGLPILNILPYESKNTLSVNTSQESIPLI